MKQARHRAAARWPLQLSGEIDKMVAEPAKEDDDNPDQVIERKPHIADEVIMWYHIQVALTTTTYNYNCYKVRICNSIVLLWYRVLLIPRDLIW